MRLRLPSVLLFTALAPFALQAGNPRILIKGDPPNPTIIVSNSFTFGADNLGGGVLSFQNETGQNWNSLLVSTTLPTLTSITVGPGPFEIDTISESLVPGGVLYNILFGPTTTGGVANGGLFSINLNDSGEDPAGAGSWGAGRTFDAKANATPEPSSIFLMLAGSLCVAGVIYRRRRVVRA